MQISKFDITVLTVMAIVVVAISFVMPTLGLTSTSTSESEIPQLNVSSNMFDFTGDRPEFPNTPSEGTLQFNTTRDPSFSDNQIWLEGDTTEGVELTLIQNVSDDTTAEVILTRWNSSGVAEQDRAYIGPNASQEAVISVEEYVIAVDQGENAEPPEHLQVGWKVDTTADSEGGFIGRIPLVGGIFGAASDVAAVIAWGLTIFIWFSQSLVQGSLNALTVVFEASVYFITLLNWLATTYFSVVTAAPGWAKIFVSIPGIILSVMLGKIVAVFISLLPAT